jgi:hypothetical protein
LKRTAKGGEVQLQFVVGCDGLVDSSTVAVLRSTDSLFTRPSVKAIIGFRFSPATLNGHAVAYRLLQVVRFQMGENP